MFVSVTTPNFRALTAEREVHRRQVVLVDRGARVGQVITLAAAALRTM